MGSRDDTLIQLARQHDAAREWAQELRRRAIAQFWNDLDAAASRAWRSGTSRLARRAAAWRSRATGGGPVAGAAVHVARRA